MTKAIYWFDEPEEDNYPAGVEYLSLLVTPAAAKVMIERLRSSPISHFKAKDILRAAELSPLGISNDQVEHTLDKIRHDKKLSPLLLVRGTKALIIADGYHRLCAVYEHDEDMKIPCKII
jgi:hypothetical protein